MCSHYLLEAHQGQQLDFVDEQNLFAWVAARTELLDVAFVDTELFLSGFISPGNAEHCVVHVAVSSWIWFLRPLSLI
jgi:hypothetical protein